MTSTTISSRGATRALAAPWLRLHQDLRWLVPVSLAVVLLCAAPYVVSTVLGPTEMQRDGTFWFVQDFSQYEAAMREGARGSSWLVHDHFTAEPHAAVMMYPLYVGLGKLASILGLPPMLPLSGMEWVGRLAVLLSVYAFAATFSAGTRQRCLAVLLAFGSLGLGAWLVPVRAGLDAVGAHALAAVLPGTINPYLELNSFGVLFSAPHLMLALAFTVASAPLYLQALRHHSWMWHLLLAADVAALSLVHPFNVPVLVSVLGTHALVTRRGSGLIAAAAAAFAATPMLIYNLLVFGADPFWSSTYAAQNLMPSPAPWLLPIEFGLVLLAAPLAWPIVRDWPSERRNLLLLWLALGLIWMYVPVSYQRRLAFGVQPALALLAAVGLVHLDDHLRRARVGQIRRRLLNDAVAILAVGTSTLVYVSLLASAATNRPAEVYLWTRAEATAANWLAEHSTDQDVVLSSLAFGNRLAGAIDGRVVVGHAVATRDFAHKVDMVARFYAPDTSSTERARILSESGATFVAVGPTEQAMLGSAGNLWAERYLEPVYRSDAVQLFRVRR